MFTRLLITALGANLAVALPATVAQAAADPIALPVAHVSDMVVDDTNGHVYFSQGSVDTGLVVTDLAGGNPTTVPDLPNARGMTLSPDKSTLYVALRTTREIAAIDTETLTVRERYNLGLAATCPNWLTHTAGKIYFGYGCSERGTVGSLDLAGDEPVVALDLLRLGRKYTTPPLVRSTPAKPNLLFVGETGNIGASIGGRPMIVDLSSGTAEIVASTDPSGCSSMKSATFTADGGRVILSCNSLGEPGTIADRHVALSTTDLSLAGDFPSAALPWAVATSPDGAFVFAGTYGLDGKPATVHVERPDGSLVHRYELPVSTTIEQHGLAVSADSRRLYVVTSDRDTDFDSLRIITDFAQTGSTLTVDGPAAVQAYDPVTITGRLELHGEVTISPQRIQVSRRSDAVTVSLPDLTTASDGTFSMTEQSVSGAYHTYTFSYAGDATHVAATGTHKVNAEGVLSAITLSAPATSARAAKLTVTGKLSFVGTGAHTGQDVPVKQPRTIRVTKKDQAGTHTLPAVSTTATGAFSFTDTPAVGGAVTYTAAYDGYSPWVASSRTATVQVSRAATPLSVTTNGSTYSYGRTATVTAKLGATYNGRSVCLYAQRHGAARTTLKCGAVSKAGMLSAAYVINRRTTFSASFAGDHRFAPATASRTVYSYASVSGKLTGYRSSSGSSKVFRPTVKPKLTVTVAAPAPKTCVYVTAQRYSKGAWRTISTSKCLRLDSASRVAYTYTGARSTGVNYRLRARFAGSTLNAATYGPPVYLRFKR